MFRRNRRQRLLWAGSAFVVVALFVFFAAINTGANLLYLVAGGLLSFLVLSLVMSRLSLRKLTVKREAPSRVHRTELFPVNVRIENRKRLMPTVSLRLEDTSGPGGVLAYVLRIPSRRAALLRFDYAFPKRGVQPLPEMELATSFPFGLMEARLRVRDNQEVVVYPRVFPVRTSVLDTLAGLGEIRRQVNAEGDEFFSLRDYVRGDDPRRIAWRASARQGNLVVKEMESEASRTVTIFVDTRRLETEDFEERFEEAMDLAASLSLALLQRRFSVALVAPGVQVPAAEGSNQARRILEALARIEPVEGSNAGAFPGPLASSMVRFSTHLLVTPDQSHWGARGAHGGLRVVAPREVLRV